MRLLTWNINGLDDEALDERTEAAVFTAVLGAPLEALHNGGSTHEPPDVIVLQEVVAHTLLAHLRPHLSAGGYVLAPEVAPERTTFEVIAVRAPYRLVSWASEPLPDSVYGRFLNVAELDGPDGPFRVLTAHFDSGKENGVQRRRQLRHIDESLTSRGVFAGDANLRKAEWEEERPLVTMRDAWQLAGEPKDARVTWRRIIDGEEHTARFDRVFVGTGIGVRSMRPVGTGALTSKVAISDHIGLMVDIGPEAPASR